VEAAVRRSRLVSRLVSAACALLAAAAALALGPAAAWAATVNYVALGDSYSSGVGAGDYLDSSGDCDRSPNAYSALWADADAPSSYTSVACSGATTADVLNSQVPALRSSTTLVSITVGGNDENFSGVMTDCNFGGTDTCVSEVRAAEADARGTLPGKLDTLFDAISAAAPDARVVVLGYPDFYDLNSSCTVGLSDQSHQVIDEGIDVLDGVLSAAASRHGFVFADVRGAFAGHEICDSNRWLHSVNFLDLTESYHPTADGQAKAYYPVFASAA